MTISLAAPAATASPVEWRRGLAPTLQRLSEGQAGTVSRRQLLHLGFTDSTIEANLRGRRWQRVHEGVYATFTGPLPFGTRVWAATLACGPGAVASHITALRLSEMRLLTEAEAIHISVDHRRTVSAPDEVIVHRRRDLHRFVHSVRSPPTVRFEDALLHEAARWEKRSRGVGLIADGCQQRISTSRRLVSALALLPRLPGRALWLAVLADVSTGAVSALELRYLQDVERAHGLPALQRQVGSTLLGNRIWRDGEYGEFGIVHELDGRLDHEWFLQRALDRRRDVAAASSGKVVVRHGWADVLDYSCESAGLVVELLRLRGWQGRPLRCSPICRIESATSLHG